MGAPLLVAKNTAFPNFRNFRNKDNRWLCSKHLKYSELFRGFALPPSTW